MKKIKVQFKFLYKIFPCKIEVAFKNVIIYTGRNVVHNLLLNSFLSSHLRGIMGLEQSEEHSESS